LKISHYIIDEQYPKNIEKINLNYKINIKEILQIHSIFQGLFIPEETIPIERITVIELKDFSSWIKGGEFVLTTLENFSTEELQIKLLKELIEGGVSCIGFHPGNKINENFKIFPETINYAKKFNFPILELAPTSTYAEVIELIFGLEMKKYDSKVNILNNVNKLLFQYLSQNLSEHKLLENVGELTGLQLVILDANMTPISQYQIDQTYKAIIKSSSFKKYMNSEGIIKTLINERKIIIEVLLETKKVDMFAQSISGSKYVDQILVVMGNLNQTIIDRVTKTMISALNIKKNQALENRFRIIDEANNYLFEEKNIPAAELSYANMNQTLKKKSSIILVDINAEMKYQNSKELDYLDNLKFRIVKQLNTKLDDENFSSWYNDLIVIFLTRNSNSHKKYIAENLLSNIKSTYPTLDMQFGVSSSYTSDLYKAYKEALFALKYDKKNEPQIQLFDDIGFHKIFTDFDNDYYIKQFYDTALSPLHTLKIEKQVELMKTLEVFLDQNLSFKDTANHLFVHPNTVRYRIQSIKELYKDDNLFSDPDKRFNLLFAVKLSSVF